MLHQDESNKREKSKAQGVDFEDGLRDAVEDAVQKVCGATGCSVSACCAVAAAQRWPPAFMAPGNGFMEDSFSTDLGGLGDGGFGMIQGQYIYCALYF